MNQEKKTTRAISKQKNPGNYICVHYPVRTLSNIHWTSVFRPANHDQITIIFA